MVKHTKNHPLGLTAKQIADLAGISVSEINLAESSAVYPHRANGTRYVIAHKHHFRDKVIDKIDLDIKKAKEILRHLKKEKAQRQQARQEAITPKA